MFPRQNYRTNQQSDLQEESTRLNMDFQQTLSTNEKDESSNYLKVITMKVSKWN